MPAGEAFSKGRMFFSAFAFFTSLSESSDIYSKISVNSVTATFHRIFIAKGIEVNKVGNSGGTALMFAAGGGHNETTRLLLEFSADPNIVVHATQEYILQVKKSKEDVEPHKDGVTALHVAALGGHIGTVMLLVSAGAMVNVTDDEGMTPLTNALKGSHDSVAAYLVEHGADPNDVLLDEKGKKHNLLMDAIVVSNKEFALLLIEKGANISHVDAEGVSVSTQAAHQGLLPVVAALVEKGADIAVSNKMGINPLIAAASEGHHEVVKVLLARGKGDVNAKDKDGTNALMAASVRGHKEVVRQLLEGRADVNSQVSRYCAVIAVIIGSEIIALNLFAVKVLTVMQMTFLRMWTVTQPSCSPTTARTRWRYSWTSTSST